MTHRIELELRALDSLAQIDSYLRERSPVGARNVRTDIRRTLDLLADFPLIGNRLSIDHLRVAVTPRYHYRIVYRVQADVVQVLQVYHYRQRVREG
ncbi:MAG: type II toxin-antitoxin system RelE/ParE family toxin [Minwuia sp.]|nr:type II toxin-antitoxin system RelE/ParE family toxin [Minwuia sp.]